MRSFAVASLLVGLGLTGTPWALAATFTVNATADAVDTVPGDATCATAAGTCTLRAAVQEANALAGADLVVLPAGTFRLTLLGSGEDLAATGDLDVLQPLTIDGAGRDVTIIDGIAGDRVVEVAASNAFTLTDLTVRNGLVAGAGGGVSHLGGGPLTFTDTAFRSNRATDGGAVSTTNGSVTITGSVFEDNLAGSNAGGVAHFGGAGGLEFRGSTFHNNLAVSAGGGTVRYTGTGDIVIDGSTFTQSRGGNGGALSVGTPGTVTITGTRFEDCRATAGSDGGAVVVQAGSAVVRDTVFRRNVAEGGYGAMLMQATNGITLTGCTVEDNRSLGGGGFGGLGLLTTSGGQVLEDTVVRGNSCAGVGGGLFVTSAAGVTVGRLVIEDNQAGTVAGGSYIGSGAELTITSSRIANNTALGGVAGGLYVASTAALTITDTSIVGNTALSGLGGGAFLSSGSTLTVDRCTVADNTVVGGPAGGLFTTATTSTELRNSTFSGNFAQSGAGGVYVGGPTVALTNCTFADNEALAMGAAILNASPSTTIRASVIASTGVPSCAGGALTSADDNVDQDGSCALAGGRDRSGIDPQLGPLQDNGGPTLTREPLPGSPLIDGVGGGACVATDQRNVTRPTDGNSDGTAACDVGAVEFVDECPADPAKRLVGVCGCGVPDVDANTNGAVDCLVNAELKARITTSRTVLASLTGEKTDAQTAAKADLTALADGLLAYCTTNAATIVTTSPGVKLVKLAKKARNALRAARKGKGAALQKKQGRGGTALDALDGAVAPQA